MLTFSASLTTSPPTITGQRPYADLSATVSQPSVSSKEINRLLTAAVVNRRFRQLLLADPLAALHNGYNGENFRLTLDEVNLVQSIHATTLPDFAAQLLEKARDLVGKAEKERSVDAEPAGASPAREEEKRKRALRYAPLNL
jgi:hypothetical protein